MPAVSETRRKTFAVNADNKEEQHDEAIKRKQSHIVITSWVYIYILGIAVKITDYRILEMSSPCFKSNIININAWIWLFE